jgi:hypothetical protein
MQRCRLMDTVLPTIWLVLGGHKVARYYDAGASWPGTDNIVTGEDAAGYGSRRPPEAACRCPRRSSSSPSVYPCSSFTEPQGNVGGQANMAYFPCWGARVRPGSFSNKGTGNNSRPSHRGASISSAAHHQLDKQAWAKLRLDGHESNYDALDIIAHNLVNPSNLTIHAPHELTNTNIMHQHVYIHSFMPTRPPERRLHPSCLLHSLSVITA